MRNHTLWKLEKLELHDFTKLSCIEPLVHGSAIDSKLKSFMISRKLMKTHEISWKLMISTRRTTVSTAKASEHEPMVSSFATSPPLFILCAAKRHVRDAKSCSRRHGLLRARDPEALALQRNVERSYSLDIMILPHSTELQLWFHEAHPP